MGSISELLPGVVRLGTSAFALLVAQRRALVHCSTGSVAMSQAAPCAYSTMLPIPPPIPPLDPTSARRIRKRTNGYLAILRSPEYAGALQLWFGGHIERMPDEPNPADLTVSKRAWEASMQQWRLALQRIVASQ